LTSQIAIRQADGSALGWLFDTGHGIAPAWSPDSNWLVFVSGVDLSTPTEIYIGQPGSMMRIAMTTTGGANPTWIRR
jgi:Tol biopolymer transport system component